MSVRIRLQRHGTHKRPFYRIVVADQRAPRDGRFIELLGVYDPLAEKPVVNLKLDRVAYWQSVGAESTETAEALIRKAQAGETITVQEYEAQNRERKQERRRSAVVFRGVDSRAAKKEAAAEVSAPAAEETTADA